MPDNEIKNEYFVSKQEVLLQENQVIFEGMTSVSAIFHAISAGISDRQVLKIYFDRERLQKKAKEYHFLESQAKKFSFDLILTDRDTLDRITTGNTHGGIVAVCTKRALPFLHDAAQLPTLPFGKNDGFFVYLEGIEDPYNFGYTLRSLYAAGVDGVILSPRNWMEVAGIVARSSAGASEQLPIAIAEPAEAIAYMKGLGYTVVCAGIRDSVSMYDANLQFPILLVIGGEKRGISAALLAQSDCTVRIDYGRNFRGSLSAASAATVLAFEVLRQNTAQKATKE
jgi:23S rRNA (guanosine2251-2'-O)-methyltransferase